MVTSKKILTVTYGTFSCTLEGFDDPFTTLQKVAEYFRKLAAEDRQFGTAPRMPDTAILKSIAEENVPNVDAELADNGVVLRQADTLPEAEPVFDSRRNDDDDDAIAPARGGLGFFRSRRPAEDDDAEDQTLYSDDDEPATTHGDPVEAETLTDDTADDLPEITPAQPERHTAGRRSVQETLAAIRENVRLAGGGLDREEQAGGSVEPLRLQETDSTDDPAEDDALFAEQHTPETAVADHSDDAEDEVLFAEQEPIPPQIAGLDDDTAEIATAEDDTETALFEQDDDADDDYAEDTDPSGFDTSALRAAISAARLQDDGEVEETAEDLPQDASVEDRSIEMSFEDDLTEDRPDDAHALAADDDAADHEVKDDHLFMTADDAPNMVEEKPAEEAEAPDPFDTLPSYDGPSSLSDEDEEDLARQLAAAMLPDDAEAEIAQAEDEHEDEDEDDAPQSRRADRLRAIPTLSEDDAALDRLLQKTESKMDRPEQKRRLNALDQLKAAVAATQADKAIQRSSADRETRDLAAYREDLRQVQDHAPIERDHPSGPEQRPAAAAAQVERPQTPLILVSEQRIDDPVDQGTSDQPAVEVAETDGNLALKRDISQAVEHAAEIETDDIQGIPADAFAEANSFEDFAERIGAFDLIDLLEASAAYTAIVEHKPRFSRAQVMSKVARLTSSNSAYTKEAGLRAFGKLLREGKILRAQDGQFAISKASRFSIASRFDADE